VGLNFLWGGSFFVVFTGLVCGGLTGAGLKLFGLLPGVRKVPHSLQNKLWEYS
jgi:hypothetical protein